MTTRLTLLAAVLSLFAGCGEPPPDPPEGFTIEVADPIHGPFAIGSGAHFGLGLFVPDGAKHVG